MMALPHVILTISSKLVDKTNFVGNCRRLMRKLMLVAAGTAPAAASATVHLAELGTTAVSGVSH
jgi:hypothetical protein